jgi:FAD synthase
VVVIPPFVVDGQEVRSSAIREAIARADFDTAARLLGRQASVTGSIVPAADGHARLDFRLPMALPPDGDYPVTVDGAPSTLRIVDAQAFLAGVGTERRVTVTL